MRTPVTLNYGSQFADSVFAGLSPAGIVLPNGGHVAGALVSNTGKALSEVVFTVSAQAGSFNLSGLFDPTRVYVGFAVDFDGTAYVTPHGTRASVNSPDVPLLTQLAGEGHGPVGSIGGRICIPSTAAAAWRFYVLNFTNFPIIVSPVNISQS